MNPATATEPELRIVLWNIEWADPHSERGSAIQQILASFSPDIICLTEGAVENFPNSGHTITSQPDYGYQAPNARRKTLLWSRHPWRDLDATGDPRLPTGRFIAATTDTPLGPLRFLGVCIPWRDAHVRTGRRDRQPWQDHLAYLDGLQHILRTPCEISRVLLGDFNQRWPAYGQPEAVASALTAALAPAFTVHTGGPLTGAPGLSIDHIATDDSLATGPLTIIPASTPDGKKLSDHFGIATTLRHATHLPSVDSVCPVCGARLISEKCKVVCRSAKCRYRIVFNCAEF